jgi:hypothetical protein
MQLCQDVSNNRLRIRSFEVLGSATRELFNERPVLGTISCFQCLLNHIVIGFQSGEVTEATACGR